MDTNNSISAKYQLLNEHDIQDISLMQNIYDQCSAVCVLYAKVNKTDLFLRIEISNVLCDITLEDLLALCDRNVANDFDLKNYLFAYGIYLNNSGSTSKSHNPIFKSFDRSCFIIKDIISQHSNIHLIKNKNKEPIHQKNGLILQPRISHNCNINIENTGDSREKSIITTHSTLPTINTINKNVAPKITVLVVEDNPINCKILSKILKKHKIHYKLAKNGLEAIETYCLRRN